MVTLNVLLGYIRTACKDPEKQGKVGCRWKQFCVKIVVELCEHFPCGWDVQRAIHCIEGLSEVAQQYFCMGTVWKLPENSRQIERV